MSKIILPQKNCLTADEFVDAISPRGENFRDQRPNAPWLFRGQGADFPLIPSMFRNDENSKKKLKLLTDRNLEDYGELLLFERDIIIQFFQIADKRGLIIPDDSQDLRNFLEKLSKPVHDGMVKLSFRDWRMKDKALSLIALAQHYRIPTRLLDWTYSSFIAAFFAGESALHDLIDGQRANSERLVVWSFYYPVIGKQDEYSKMVDPVSIVTAPKATNTNLKAQQGVFTLINFFYAREFSNEYTEEYYKGEKFHKDWYHAENPGVSLISIGVHPPLEIMIDNLAQMEFALPSTVKELVQDCKFQKFTLPISETPCLLRLLAEYDITASTVYPGYHSIISDLQNRNCWK